RAQDPPEVIHRESFFDNERRREVLRMSSAHRQIVDRSIDRKVSDVPAGKENRVDDVRVGTERNARPIYRQYGSIVLSFERWVMKRRQNHLLNELVGQLSTTAVCKHDRLVIENGCRTCAENHFRSHPPLPMPRESCPTLRVSAWNGLPES